MNLQTTHANIQPFKLVFIPVNDETVYGPTCMLDFEFPVGTKHTHSLFFTPDSLDILIDKTNTMVEAKVLTKNRYLDLPLDNLQYLNKERIDRNLFNLYFRCIVDLFNFYYQYNVPVREISEKIVSEITDMKNYLLCNTYTVDFSKRIPVKEYLDDELFMISITMTHNIMFVLSFLMPLEVQRQILVPFPFTFETK